MAAVHLHTRSASLASTSSAQVSGQQPKVFAHSNKRHATLVQNHRGGLGVRCMAKGAKKGGNKKGGSSIPKPNKGGEGEASPSPPSPATPYTSGEVIMHSLDLIDSYYRAVGSTIFKEPVEVVNAAKALWDADFVVISHGTEEDPIFNYGNAKTMEVFETTWPEFTSMPSRKYCPEENQPTRNNLLQSAQSAAQPLKGIVRQTTKGRLFEVDEGVVWTLVASDGEVFGQAAVIRQWHFLDEREGEEPKEGSVEASKGTDAVDHPSPVSGGTAAQPSEAEPVSPSV